MENWVWLIAAFAALWGLQSIGTFRQVQHYRAMLGEITKTYADGFVGAGNAQGRLRKGVIVLLVASPDGIVRKAMMMEGRSVFARFEDCAELVGRPVAGLIEGEPFGADAKGRNEATAKAAQQIETMRADRRAKGLEGLAAAGA